MITNNSYDFLNEKIYRYWERLKYISLNKSERRLPRHEYNAMSIQPSLCNSWRRISVVKDALINFGNDNQFDDNQEDDDQMEEVY